MTADLLADPYNAVCPFDEIQVSILRALADGRLRRTIARDMGITKHYLDVLISRMLIRTRASNSTHLVATALRSGWIE